MYGIGVKVRTFFREIFHRFFSWARIEFITPVLSPLCSKEVLKPQDSPPKLKWTFYARMGTINGRSYKDLTKAEQIKKRWQEYSSDKNTTVQKGPNDSDNHDGVVTHLELDILECEVKWALESITMNKASEDDRSPAELFQILKGDAAKVLHSICHQI